MMNYRRHLRSVPFTVLFAVVCAALVILGRTLPFGSTVRIGDMPFPYTDAFVMISYGLGGLGCGLLAFVILFAGEFMLAEGDPSIYASSVYLIIGLAFSAMSFNGWFADVKKTLSGIVLLSVLLALSWYFAFTVLAVDADTSNMLYGIPVPKLFLCALPQTVLAVLAVGGFFKYAPDKYKRIAGWADRDIFSAREGENRSVLARRITVLSLLWSVLLGAAAIFSACLFSAAGEGVPFSLGYFVSRWQFNLQLGLMMLCTSAPVAFLVYLYVLMRVAVPINEMSYLMEKYYEDGEELRPEEFSELRIRTGDEIEKLYRSMLKMQGDISSYIARLVEEERRSAHLTKEFMLALSKAVDAKDHYTSGHSQRVAEYSREIARRMGKSPGEQEDIYTMGLLHDIGKIGVPESIINKKGKLTDEEFQAVREHPVTGHEILKTVEEIPRLAVGARWHHERYDGRGYPDGLKDGEIPEEARIIGVADAYDAMTSNRSYRNVMPREKVREQIENGRGTQFDPRIADVMLTMMEEDKEFRMQE
ncbi:MAG: HD-GYP domain-containing protein [Abditibacteriota bacterium]|nr:HD-GYP domain-containing protein [Abditibacteriota bacterium]